jgi:hypothetical protein
MLANVTAITGPATDCTYLKEVRIVQVLPLFNMLVL